MAVNIIITVVGQGSGSGGESRSFPYSLIATSPPLVTLSLDDTGGVTSYLWELLNIPIGASSILSSQSSATPTFTPTAEKWGTYLIRCTIIRNGVQEIGTVGLSFRTVNQDLRFPAAGEKIEFDEDNGWMSAEYYFWKYVDELSLGSNNYWERVGTILSPYTNGDTLNIGSGSESAPSYGYESDQDTGRYLFNTGVEAFCAGGVDLLLFGNDSGPYIKAAEGHQYLKIGNYKTTSGNYSEVIIEGVGHVNHGGGKATVQATAPASKITELNLLSDSVSGNSDINITADSGASISAYSAVNILSAGEGPTNINITAFSKVNAVASAVTLLSNSLFGNSSMLLASRAPSGTSYLYLGDEYTEVVGFADLSLAASTYPLDYFLLSSSPTQFSTLYTNYGTMTLVEILNSLYGSVSVSVSPGIGINVEFDVGDYEVSVKDAPASEIDFEALSSYEPSNYDLNTYLKLIQGPTKLSSTDGLSSDGGSGTANVSALDGIVKASTDEGSNSYFTHWNSVTALGLTNVSVNAITANYNSGSPNITASTTLSSAIAKNKILLSLVKRESSDLEILNISSQSADLGFALNEKSLIQNNYKPEYGTGIILSGTGTRNLYITAGWMYWGISKVVSSLFDSSASSTWSNFYTPNSGSSWTKVLGRTQVDNLNYNNITSGLASLGADEFGLFWVYRNYSNTDVYLVYGTASYATQEAAEAVATPTLVPWQVSNFAYLIGRVIILQNSSTMTVTSVFIDELAGGSANVHNQLTGLQGGTTDEEYHLTANEHTQLTTNLPLAANRFVITDASNRLEDNSLLVYSPGGVTGTMTLEVDGSSASTASFTAKAPNGTTNLSIISDSHNTSGGTSYLTIQANSNAADVIYQLTDTHDWYIDSVHLLSLDSGSLDFLTTTKLINLLNTSYGSAPTPASFGSNTITVNWSTGKAFQQVIINANATTLSMTAPPGVAMDLKLLISASGGDRYIGKVGGTGGFTNVKWADNGTGYVDLATSSTVVQLSTHRVLLVLHYDGTNYYGHAVSYGFIGV